MSYPFREIEKKWQKFWEKNKFYQAKDSGKKPKKYILVEFPYPSGDGLHVGHVRSYSALDAVSRQKRMKGYDVLYPIGWDAFGLPTENYAIKKGIHPSIITKRNIKVFKRQLKSLGLSFDWSREINTTDPGYYKWTQWIFLQFFKHGLAYQAEMPINWCPSCKIGLANEEVIDGRCERCGSETKKRNIRQWLLRITKYADRLLEDLNKIDYLEKIKTQQINWIGKSEGAEIDFPIKNSKEKIKVFTTRPDTLFGATYMVLAPEHKLISNLKPQISNIKEVENYIKEAYRKSDLQRTDLAKEKTGVEFKGIKAINPANKKEIPVFVADYVLSSYGTGAIMAVPAHDERDFEFAKKFRLPIQGVILPLIISNPLGSAQGTIERVTIKSECWTGDGELINSDEFNGMASEKVKWKITKFVNGKKMVQYKLRDWIFSRQHYWGEPIPIVHCDKCGAVPVPEKDLPVKLPYIKKYQPTKTGKSPLAAIIEWVNVKCPKCKGPAKRETDTMPNWAGSSWYFLRYLDPKNKKCFADFKKLKYWLPVDLYNGGMEHTTLHLLYSRFWHKFLYDLKLVPASEPYAARRSHGMVLAEDGRKMSKSFGNVINPDEIVKKFGADTLRMYEMFMGPFDQAISWNTQGVVGIFRFLNRVWQLREKTERQKNLKTKKQKKEECRECEILLHKSIKKISEDLDEMKFNTAVSQLMILTNEFEKHDELAVHIYEQFLKILAPFAPHLAEELWRQLNHEKSIHLEKWPQYNPQLIKEEKFELVIQINGKFRDKISVSQGITEKEAKELAVSREKIKNWLKDKKVIKTIFVPGKLVNIVIS